MACEHKHLKCVNCEFICADCGAKVEIPVYKTEQAEPTEKPKRRAKKKGAETELPYCCTRTGGW